MVDNAVQNTCVYHSYILLNIPISVYPHFSIFLFSFIPISVYSHFSIFPFPFIPISVYSRFRIQHPQVQQAFDKIENVTRIHRDNYESFQVRKRREGGKEGGGETEK